MGKSASKKERNKIILNFLKLFKKLGSILIRKKYWSDFTVLTKERNVFKRYLTCVARIFQYLYKCIIFTQTLMDKSKMTGKYFKISISELLKYFYAEISVH